MAAITERLVPTGQGSERDRAKLFVLHISSSEMVFPLVDFNSLFLASSR